jgi:hypothetical protein
MQEVRFGLSLGGQKEMPISLGISSDGTVEIVGTNVPDFSYRLTRVYAQGKPFDVSIIVVGNRCEMDIAGIQAYRGPILEDEKSRQLCLLFDAVMAKGKLDQISWATSDARK